jgi:hypothetical protein
MKHFLVSWKNYRNEYRDSIVCAVTSIQAKSLVKAAYKQANHIRARELKL